MWPKVVSAFVAVHEECVHQAKLYASLMMGVDLDHFVHNTLAYWFYNSYGLVFCTPELCTYAIEHFDKFLAEYVVALRVIDDCHLEVVNLFPMQNDYDLVFVRLMIEMRSAGWLRENAAGLPLGLMFTSLDVVAQAGYVHRGEKERYSWAFLRYAATFLGDDGSPREATTRHIYVF
jgi:hypothetical protein